MKTNQFLPLLVASFLAPIALNAQNTATTNPVGYVTQTLKPNIANLVGITLHKPTITSGVIDGSSGNAITDNEVNFTNLLTSGKTYILEITSDPGNGVIQEITSWNANSLNTSTDLRAFITNGTTTYKIREADTIASVFGANNSFGLTPSTDGDSATCDNILVLNSSGTAFITCFYFDDGNTQAWFDLDFNDVTNLPLIYTDSLYVRRVGGAEKTVVLSGEVKTTNTNIALQPGNNFVGSVYPAGTTFGNSNLNLSLTPSTDGETASADTILLQQPDGSYVTCFYYNDGSTQSWFDQDFNDMSNTELTSGLVIQNKGNAKNAIIKSPLSSNPQ